MNGIGASGNDEIEGAKLVRPEALVLIEKDGDEFRADIRVPVPGDFPYEDLYQLEKRLYSGAQTEDAAFDNAEKWARVNIPHSYGIDAKDLTVKRSSNLGLEL